MLETINEVSFEAVRLRRSGGNGGCNDARSKTCAVAVRNPSGEVVIQQEPLNATIYQSRLLKLPVLRGLRMLADSLGMACARCSGLRMSQWARRNGSHFSGPLAWGTIAISLAFGVGLFFLLPAFLTGLVDRAIPPLVSNLIEGLIRLAIVIGYLALAGLMPDIRRVFAYHGRTQDHQCL